MRIAFDRVTLSELRGDTVNYFTSRSGPEGHSNQFEGKRR